MAEQKARKKRWKKRPMPTKDELERIGVDDSGKSIHFKKEKKKEAGTYRKVARNHNSEY